MTNAEVIQSMTVAELAKLIDNLINMYVIENCVYCDDDDFGKRCRKCYDKYLRDDAQSNDGLLTPEQQLKWRTH